MWKQIKPFNVFNPVPRKLKQTIQILKQINLAHSMCGKIELPVLTLTGWEVRALSYFSYSLTTQKQDNKNSQQKN